jgi:CHAT domain-containing protein
LWMLREGPKRGLFRISPQHAKPGEATSPPFYWAGFVLSGNWR